MVTAGIQLAERYEVLEKIGSGGMSDVYKARDHKLNRLVAVKVLKSEYSNDETFVRKFRVEAQSAAGLSHPNIVSVFDVGEEKGIHYIVMELIQGITLKKYIEMKGKLDTKEALNISVQIASGLQAAHDNRIIHRDIKPQNVIMSRDGKVKVTDFGIAKVADSTTVTTTAAGSVHYISPEQARGGYSDVKSDIYSLGITMYEMLTGRVPYDGETNVAVALLHIQGEMVPPRQIDPSIPKSFEKIILKCTQKKPDRRYASARDLIADLRKVLTNPEGEYVTMGTPVMSAALENTVVLPENIRQGGYKPREIGGLAGGTPSTQISGTPEAAGASGTAAAAGTAAGGSGTSGKTGASGKSGASGAAGRTGKSAASGKAGTSGKSGTAGSSGRRVRTVDPDTTDEFEIVDVSEGGISPALEKIMIVLGVIGAGILIVALVMILGKAKGIFSGNASEEGPLDWLTGKTETQTDTPFAFETDTYPEPETYETEPPTEPTEPEGQMVEVPDLKGLTEAQAQVRAGEVGLFISVTTEENDDIPDGQIFEQSPEQGEMLDPGASVKVKIAKPSTVIVDDVSGLTYEQAKIALEAKGITISQTIYEFDENVAADLVIRTSPAARETISKGGSVILYISKGKENKLVEMPQIVGYSLEDAINILHENGLEYGQIYETYSNEVPEGKVMQASVGPGTLVEDTVKINLVVSLGPENRIYTGFIGIYDSPIGGFAEGESIGVRVVVYKPDGSQETIVNGYFTSWVPVEEYPTSTVAGNGHYEIYVTDSEGVESMIGSVTVVFE